VARLAGLRRPSAEDEPALYGSSFDAAGAGGEVGPASFKSGSSSLSGSAANRAPRARVVHDAVRASVVGFGAPVAAASPGGKPASAAATKPASGRSAGMLRRELQSNDTVLGTPSGEPLVVCEPAVRKPGTGRSQARVAERAWGGRPGGFAPPRRAR
jgi:hypothetical protein